MRIEGQPRDLGGFSVRRLLPQAQRRSLGPFLFLDHLGPADFAAGEGVDVRPHPHIGLSTLTWLMEGGLMHRDSLGTVQEIRPGEVNWMTAGRGIQHSERTPAALRAAGHRLDALQLWVGLPKADEAMAPAFAHHPAEALPTIAFDGARRTLVAGTAFGAVAPVDARSPLFAVDVEAEAGAKVAFPQDHAERGVYVVSGGAVMDDGTQVPAGTLLILPDGAGDARSLTCEGPARLMLLGGAPLEGPRHLWWNLVASDMALIDAAKADWAAAPRGGRFGTVPGETEWIPLPPR
jgi:hypothetical protein